jgi:integrase
MKQSPYVTEVVEAFLASKGAREKATRASYASILKGSEAGTRRPLGLALGVYFHGRKFATLTHDDVARWFGQRVDGGSQNTKHRISKAARHFLDWAHRRGYTKDDLASAIEPFRQGQSRQDALDWETTQQVLAAIPEFRYRFAAAWLFFTGCRVSEATRAHQRDVRWDGEAGLYIWSIPATTAKTHNARDVYLPPVLADMLDEARQLHQPRPECPILWDAEGRGFGRVENPASPITQKAINNALERARESAGLVVHLTAHVCRHTYCTNWIRNAGADEMAMEKLSRQVGASVGVLRKTYVHYRLGASDWDAVRQVRRP